MPMLGYIKAIKKVQANSNQAGREIGLTVFNIIRTNLKLKYKTDKRFKRTERFSFFIQYFPQPLSLHYKQQ